MGTRGPVGFSDKVHALHGTRPRSARDAERAAQLKLRPMAPDAPAWLNEAARAEWAKLVPELDRQGVVAVVDQPVLGAYCASVAVLERTVTELANCESITVQGARGFVKSPQFTAWRDAAMLTATLAAKCFATPECRVRLRVAEVDGLNPKADSILD